MQSVRELNMSVGTRPRGMSRFDSSFQDFLYDNGLHYYTTQFYQELNVRSVQDLALLSDDELRQVLPPTEMTRFRDALRKGGVKRIPPEQLVGLWIDVEGFGPGRVVHYHKVSNRFMFDSKHSVDFKGPEFKVLLRRRKFMRWNGGARYIVLETEPSAMDAVQAVKNEHEVMETYKEEESSPSPTTTATSTQEGGPTSNNVDESWEACIDPNTGDTYYYNLITLETSWTLPEKKQPSFSAPPAAPAPLPPLPPSSLLPPVPTDVAPVKEVGGRPRPESVKLLARPPSLRAMPKVPLSPKPETATSPTSSSPTAETPPAIPPKPSTMTTSVEASATPEASESTEHDEAKNRHLDKTLRPYKVINPKNLGKSPRGRSNSPPGRPSSRSEGGIPVVPGGLSSTVVPGKARIALISDLDGTMLPGPTKVDGKVVHPCMSSGATYAPLVQFLEEGGSVFGVTGGTLGLQRSRFWDVLPLKARREGRVMLFCETGMVLYRSKHQMDTLYPDWDTPPPPATEPNCPVEEPAASDECKRYQIDMTAAAFGQCKCGKPKADHSDAALSAKGNKGKASVAKPPAPTPSTAAEYTGDGGEPVEDKFYGPFEGNTQRYLSEDVIVKVIAAMRLGLREFFTDLKANRSLLEDDHWIQELAESWADKDAPVTQDHTLTPRIELRKNASGKTFGMIIAGVPTQYGEKYLSPKLLGMAQEVSGLPTGRLCFDVTVPGLGKQLVLDFLLRMKYITSGAVIAMADSPSGNDKGLTEMHNKGIPFVSVYGGSHQSMRLSKLSNPATMEKDEGVEESDTSPAPQVLNEELTQILDKKVAPHLISCHVGGNEQGSAAVISRLIPLNRMGLPTMVDGKESWLDVERVADQIVQYAREDLFDL